MARYRVTVKVINDDNEAETLVMECDSAYVLTTDIKEWLSAEIDKETVVRWVPDGACDPCRNGECDNCTDGNRVSGVMYECQCAINRHEVERS